MPNNGLERTRGTVGAASVRAVSLTSEAERYVKNDRHIFTLI